MDGVRRPGGERRTGRCDPGRARRGGPGRARGRRRPADVRRRGPRRPRVRRGTPCSPPCPASPTRPPAPRPGSLLAPMPGTVVRIADGLAAGARVEAGQPLLWLEAMKMEHKIAAPASGTLTALHAAPGGRSRSAPCSPSSRGHRRGRPVRQTRAGPRHRPARRTRGSRPRRPPPPPHTPRRSPHEHRPSAYAHPPRDRGTPRPAHRRRRARQALRPRLLRAVSSPRAGTPTSSGARPPSSATSASTSPRSTAAEAAASPNSPSCWRSWARPAARC